MDRDKFSELSKEACQAAEMPKAQNIEWGDRSSPGMDPGRERFIP